MAHCWHIGQHWFLYTTILLFVLGALAQFQIMLFFFVDNCVMHPQRQVCLCLFILHAFFAGVFLVLLQRLVFLIQCWVVLLLFGHTCGSLRAEISQNKAWAAKHSPQSSAAGSSALLSASFPSLTASQLLIISRLKYAERTSNLGRSPVLFLWAPSSLVRFTVLLPVPPVPGAFAGPRTDAGMSTNHPLTYPLCFMSPTTLIGWSLYSHVCFLFLSVSCASLTSSQIKT